MEVNSGGWGTTTEQIKWTHFGWPVIHLNLVKSEPFPPSGIQSKAKWEWRWFALVINVITYLLFLGSTCLVVEIFLRNYRRLQFSVGNLILITGVLGVILAMLTYKPEFLLGGRWYGLELSYLVAWPDVRQPLRWPVLFGLACTLYSIGWLGLTLPRRAYRLLRP